MNVNLFVSIVGLVSLIVGVFIGVQIFKAHTRRVNRKLLKNAREVLSGERKNKITIDGQEYDASKFKLRDEEDNEKVFDLKGGEIEQDGEEKNKSREEKIPDRRSENLKGDKQTTEESSNSGREEKRVVRTRFTRTRRFW